MILFPLQMADKQNIDLAINGAHILTIDQEMTEYKKGSVYITGNRISWIGPEDQRPEGCLIRESMDASGKLIIPTFFNSHNHAAMSIFRGLGNDMSLNSWLNDFIWPAEKKQINPSTVYLGTILSAIEMIRSGSGIFSDMYFFEEEVAKVCEDIGIRGIIGEAILDFPTPSRATPQEAIQYTRQIHDRFKSHPLITVSVAVHAPYSCSPEIIRQAGELAKELNIPANIHLAETISEVEIIQRRFGKSPVQHLFDLGFLSPRAVAHHSVHLTKEDRCLIKETGTSVVTLPNSNMKLGSGACEVGELISRGINVAIGTDGPASNNHQSLLREIQQLARLERVINLDPTRIPARELVRISTINGARAYHLDEQIGSLETGKLADLQIINPDQPHWYPRYDVYNSIAYAMQSHDVESVIIDGKPVMLNRVLVNIDEERIYREIKKLVRKNF
jgi:5-methylthioadenosine/S-adenosylhomocysteine deaminase